jgi:hypothetical protein
MILWKLSSIQNENMKWYCMQLWVEFKFNWIEFKISLKRNGMQIGEEYGVRFLFIFKHKFEITFFHASLFAIF